MDRVDRVQVNVNRPRITWDTHTALAVIVLASLVSLAVLRGSLSAGGAVQP